MCACSEEYCSTTNSALLSEKFLSVKRKFCSVKTKCVAAKIYGLRLGFTNSNLSSHTFTIYIHMFEGFSFDLKSNFLIS